MNKATRNAIAMAIALHTGHGRKQDDYWQIIEHIRSFGFAITDKTADEYNQDLTHKHNAYKLVDMRTEKELDALLVIDEYFPNTERTETAWSIGKGFHEITYRDHVTRWEINAYIS